MHYRGMRFACQLGLYLAGDLRRSAFSIKPDISAVTLQSLKAFQYYSIMFSRQKRLPHFSPGNSFSDSFPC